MNSLGVVLNGSSALRALYKSALQDSSFCLNAKVWGLGDGAVAVGLEPSWLGSAEGAGDFWFPIASILSDTDWPPWNGC